MRRSTSRAFFGVDWGNVAGYLLLTLNCFYFSLYMYIGGVGSKSRQFTVYHMCKTWLQKVHGGWEIGGGG